MSPKILVVDDDPALTQLLRLLLSFEGWNVLAATSGVEALEIADLHLPELILLDIMMPNMDGFEVCTRLRADPRFRQTAILAFTAMSEKAGEARAYEVGFDDFIPKMIMPDQLIERMKRFLQVDPAEVKQSVAAQL